MAGFIQAKVQKELGLRVFLLSNILWIVWAAGDRAYAMIVLQVCLAAMNIRGVRTNDTSANPARSIT